MPIYEYRCKGCGHDLEAQQAFTDDPLTECPSCGGELKKLFAAPGIAFKGSGFYKTDSRSGGSGRSTSGDSSTSSDDKGASKGDGKGDGKGSSSDSSGKADGTGSSTPAKETSGADAKGSTPSTPASTTST